tara:strand:- start:366 stop:710 length:345 start_codon:yes stop_codon:yes gene_type:complete
MEYLNAGIEIWSGSYSTVVTASATTKLLIKTIHLTNVTTSNAQVTMHWLDTDSPLLSQATFSLAKDVVVPIASSFQALDGTFVLDNNDKLEMQTDISGSVHATISFVRLASDEG